MPWTGCFSIFFLSAWCPITFLYLDNHLFLKIGNVSWYCFIEYAFYLFGLYLFSFFYSHVWYFCSLIVSQMSCVLCSYCLIFSLFECSNYSALFSSPDSPSKTWTSLLVRLGNFIWIFEVFIARISILFFENFWKSSFWVRYK
jgi:hypothetical protein